MPHTLKTLCALGVMISCAQQPPAPTKTQASPMTSQPTSTSQPAPLPTLTFESKDQKTPTSLPSWREAQQQSKEALSEKDPAARLAKCQAFVKEHPTHSATPEV